VARAERGTYDVDTEMATLKGNVRLTRGKNQLNGAAAEVNMKTGVSKLHAAPGADGRVRGLLVPEQRASATAAGASR
jgi:lipopolysaccharide export system protein LptA